MFARLRNSYNLAKGPPGQFGGHRLAGMNWVKIEQPVSTQLMRMQHFKSASSHAYRLVERQNSQIQN